MCGIFFYSSSTTDIAPDAIKTSFNKLQPRGPDSSTFNIVNKVNPKNDTLINNYIGFHRLAIMDTSSNGNQPFVYEDEHKMVYLICNGEIYNYESLKNKYKNTKLICRYCETSKCTGEVEHKYNFNSNSDCEIILYMFLNFGIFFTSQALDGEYSFVIYEYNKLKNSQQIYVCRDRIGVRPLFYFINDNSIGIASEMKGLIDIVPQNTKIQVFPPSNFLIFNLNDYTLNTNTLFVYHYIDSGFIGDNYEYNIVKVDNNINTIQPNNEFISTNLQEYWKFNVKLSLQDIYSEIVNRFVNCVHKRMVSDRPLGCLLSGGLDSSLVSAIASRYLKRLGKTSQRLEGNTEGFKTLKTFTIGLAGSEDLKYAKICADFIGSDHTEFIVSETEALNAIPDVIKTIESYDITTIRASVWQYLLAKKIRETTDIKVLLVGELSDEAIQGYVYFKNAPSDTDAINESLKLVQNIHMFDGLRVDRCMSGNGLEVRLPFSDTQLLHLIYSIEPSLLRPQLTTVPYYSESKPILLEKCLIRKAFDSNRLGSNESNLLPDEILYRPKFAFSDLTNETKPWVEIIKDHIETVVSDTEYNEFLKTVPENYKFNTPFTKESYYYRKIFEKYYPGQSQVIPYFWLPNWTQTKDPSARVLKEFVDTK